jgi:signal transduction histidine kinase
MPEVSSSTMCSWPPASPPTSSGASTGGSGCLLLVAEALTNVAKYADARVASDRATCDGRYVLGEIEDDGVGGADAANGSGLRGLSHRVETLDGELSIESPKGGPTFLRARIPLSV